MYGALEGELETEYEVCKLSNETGSVVFDLATLGKITSRDIILGYWKTFISEFHQCYEEWKKRLQRCVASEGSYFEGDKVEL
ncbi:hypothetical protein TNCV_1799811 [Trichonephila clavipes]|nr:hypothetical protein TNCV_1799811 [Trichonephila clavipes]